MLKRNENNRKPSIELPRWMKSRIEKIRFDNTSGALQLTIQAAESIIFLLDKYKDSTNNKLIEVIEKTTLELTKAQPKMAPIINLANIVLFDISIIKNNENLKGIIRKNCEDYIDNLNKSTQLIGNIAANLICNDSKIIVYSYSDTILKALITAKNMNKSFNVICSESRPMNEGLNLARKLDKQGIKTTLIVDSAIYSFLSGSDLIFVGADAVSKYGLVNKIGTYGLAIAAEKLGVKFYTLCNTKKILPSNYQLKSENQKDPNEISKNVFTNVNIINYYFDLTPLDYFTGIITEEGIISPNQIKKYIERLKIHNTLIN